VSTSGLSYHDNVIEVEIRATGTGNAPQVTTRPSGYLRVHNRLSTSGRRRGVAVETGRTLGAEAIVLDGSVPQTYAGTIVVPAANPTLFTVHSFRQYLQEAGIAVEAEVVDVDDLDEALKYDDARPLF